MKHIQYWVVFSQLFHCNSLTVPQLQYLLCNALHVCLSLAMHDRTELKLRKQEADACSWVTVSFHSFSISHYCSSKIFFHDLLQDTKQQTHLR